MSFARILSDREGEILIRVRRALGEARLVLERIPVDERDGSFFDASFRQLDELFLLVVAGEFNSGKSAFINALLENASRRGRHTDYGAHHHRPARRDEAPGARWMASTWWKRLSPSHPRPLPPGRRSGFFDPFSFLFSVSTPKPRNSTSCEPPLGAAVPVYFRARRSYDFLSV